MTFNLTQKDRKRVQRVTSKFYPEMIKGFDKKLKMLMKGMKMQEVYCA